MAEKPTYEELEQRVKALEQETVKRKQVEDALRESEGRFRSLVETTSDWIWEVDQNNIYTYSSPKVKEVLGYDPEEIIGKSPFDLMTPDEAKQAKNNFDKAVNSQKEIATLEKTIAHKNGKQIILETSGIPIFDKNGDISGYRGINRDITERKQAEKKLQKSEHLLSASQKYANIGSWSWNLKTGTATWSEQHYKIYGRDIAKGVPSMENFLEIYHPDDRKPLQKGIDRAIKENKPYNIDFRIYRYNDGEERWLHAQGKLEKDEKGKPSRLIGTTQDITERRQLEQQLRQSQKMEAIGTLTGGIAHDINNILSIILTNTELATDDVPEWNPASHNLKEIKTASLRAKDVVKQLLSFGKKSDPTQKPVNINPIIEDSLQFLRSSLPTEIKIRKTIADASCIISADPTQIHQVMMNLCINAAHAMSENGGIMDVNLSVIYISKDEANQNIELKQGQYVKITISDTGHGISEEHLKKIFDPYFTTKDVGEGSGIGLSVVYGIVKSHNGTIFVDSEYGNGSTFSVFFPVIEQAHAFEEETDTTILTGNERILFVDDEKSIANRTSQTLERLGYTVTAKTSSTDALKIFRSRPDDFDLIITDMAIPEMTGDRLAKELLQIRPDIPIIIFTGHSKRINDEKAKSIGVRALVMKPIVKSVLAKTIRKVLD